MQTGSACERVRSYEDVRISEAQRRHGGCNMMSARWLRFPGPGSRVGCPPLIGERQPPGVVQPFSSDADRDEKDGAGRSGIVRQVTGSPGRLLFVKALSTRSRAAQGGKRAFVQCRVQRVQVDTVLS